MDMILGMSALFMLWNGTTCCAASRKASHKARSNVSFRPYFVKCCRITENFILIIVQRDATQNSRYIILKIHSTCFGCQPHPSSGVHKTVTTVSATGHAVLCSYLPPTWPKFRLSTTPIIRSTQNCNYSLRYWSYFLRSCLLPTLPS